MNQNRVLRAGRRVVAPGPPPGSNAWDDELDACVTAAVRGDRDAVARVLRMIQPVVVRYCRARLGTTRSITSAEDVAQEVCLAVLRALSRYEKQDRSFLAFVYGIAAHKVADAYRDAARNRSEPMTSVPEVPDLSPGPEQRAMGIEAGEEMGRLLGALSARYREILLLRVVDGLSVLETAQLVGATPGTVRVVQHRALARLRQAIARSPVQAEGGVSRYDRPQA